MSYASSLDALLSASPTGDFKSIFSTFSTSDNSSVYNTNLWGGGGHSLDFSGIIWHDDNTGDEPTGYASIANGVAITKRHVICTNHGGHGIGGNVTWIKRDGTLVTRNLSDGIKNIGGSDPSGFRVLYCNSDLPSGIATYPVMAGAIPTGTPLIKLDQQNQALIADLFTLDLLMVQPTSPTRDQYYEVSIPGDSGSPVFAVSGTQLIYLTSLVTGGAGGGPFVRNYLSSIVDACRTLDARNAQTGYTPTVVRTATSRTLSLGLTIGV